MQHRAAVGVGGGAEFCLNLHQDGRNVPNEGKAKVAILRKRGRVRSTDRAIIPRYSCLGVSISDRPVALKVRARDRAY